MPRKRSYSSGARPILDNPRLLGENIKIPEVFALGGGVFATAMLNDKLLAPITKRIVPGVNTAHNLVAKAVDTFTTVVSAIVVGKVVSGLPGRFGDEFMAGGLALAGGKAVSIIVPGASITPEFPSISGLSEIGLGLIGPGDQPKQLAAPASATSSPAPAAVGSIRMVAI